MAIIRILAAVLLPAAFWIGYFHYKDRIRPEPVRNLARSYLLGFAAALLCYSFYAVLLRAGNAAHIEIFLDPAISLPFFSYHVVVVGLVEESFKFLPFILAVRRYKAFDEPIDGIVYAAAIAVGFAGFENLGYLPVLKGFAFWGRAIASPLTHTVFSSIWGYAVARAIPLKKSIVFASVVGISLAALSHGLFNTLTFSPGLRIFSALLVLLIWTWVIRTLEKKPRLLMAAEADGS